MSDSLFSQNRIAEAHFMVVGCGALGNEVLKNLILFGARHIVIVDFDQVEVGNLSRSIFYRKEDADKGRRKVEVMAERLCLLAPELELITIDGDIAYDVPLGLIRRMDVVIGCVDSRWARYCINRLCMRGGIPWVDGGISQLEGTVRVFVPGSNCYACNLGAEGLRQIYRRMPCSGTIRQAEGAGHAPTTPIIASVIGAVEVQEALKIIHQDALREGEFTSLCGRMFYFEGQHLSSRVVSFTAYDDDCPVHECWQPIESIPIGTKQTVGDLLAFLRQHYEATEVSFSLIDDCFVDFIADRETDVITTVMCLGRDVAAFVDETASLKGKPLSAFYQHEYRDINVGFPFQQLCLAQIGLKLWDVIPVRIDGRRVYVELEKTDKQISHNKCN